MKKLLFASLAAVVLLSACSKYQMNTISAVNAQRDEKTGRFNVENDSVKISYSFAGKNAPIYIEVYNKLNEPLYIDWDRSAYIVGQKATSYANNNVHLSGDVSGVGYSSRHISYTDASINATATLPQNTTFVPPHAVVGKTVAEVGQQMDTFMDESLFTKNKVSSMMTGGEVNVKVANFTVDNTPLVFRSYVTMYTLNGNTPKFVAFENKFFVSQVMQSGLGPENFGSYDAGLGDKFYTSKTTGTGKAMAGVGIAAAIVGTAALDASVNKNNNNK